MDEECDEITQARVELRERFLRLISSLCGGKECDLKLYDNNEYKCNVRAFDPSFDNMIVENLSTPHPLQNGFTIIRLNDVISIKCDVTL
ncbi:hypothetical protein RI129_010269 [Pyrocoelia pectoralis]|uniref:Gem-associated protein 7 n=1 Tax=Pyrocoelia pectoralis TaxID=417401 RepID=A0AAN7ZGY0_9COLE